MDADSRRRNIVFVLVEGPRARGSLSTRPHPSRPVPSNWYHPARVVNPTLNWAKSYFGLL
jgi:hypothetical protein